MLSGSSRDLALLAYSQCTSVEVGAEEGREAWREESSAPLCSSSTCTGNPEAVNLKVHHSILLKKEKKKGGSRTVLTTVKGWLGGSLSSCFYENDNFHLSLPRKQTKKKTHGRQAEENFHHLLLISVEGLQMLAQPQGNGKQFLTAFDKWRSRCLLFLRGIADLFFGFFFVFRVPLRMKVKSRFVGADHLH